MSRSRPREKESRLQLHTGNRLEVLADDLARLLQTPLRETFAREALIRRLGQRLSVWSATMRG